MKYEVPIWEKYCLTLDEAAAYFGIGINKLREMTDEPNCQFVIFNGSKRLIKRRKLEENLIDTRCDLIQKESLIGPTARSGIYLNLSH